MHSLALVVISNVASPALAVIQSFHLAMKCGLRRRILFFSLREISCCIAANRAQRMARKER